MTCINQNRILPAISNKLGFLWGIIILTALTGCQDYRWVLDDFRTAEKLANDRHKDMFIFYKWWLSSESNRMHGEILPNPKVAPLFHDTVNLMLERDSTSGAAQYLSKYGITSAPAFVVVRPDGTFKTRTGYIPKERFIDFIKRAKSPPPATTQQKEKPAAG